MLGSCVTSSSKLIVFAARTETEYSSDFNSSTIPAIFFRMFLGVEGLKSDGDSVSVRAANTISLLDDVTQDPNLPSYVRTSLWQAVSTLESIRE